MVIVLFNVLYVCQQGHEIAVIAYLETGLGTYRLIVEASWQLELCRHLAGTHIHVPYACSAHILAAAQRVHNAERIPHTAHVLHRLRNGLQYARLEWRIGGQSIQP